MHKYDESNNLDYHGQHELEDAGSQMSHGDILNYTSVVDNLEDAKIELDRYRAEIIKGKKKDHPGPEEVWRQQEGLAPGEAGAAATARRHCHDPRQLSTKAHTSSRRRLLLRCLHELGGEGNRTASYLGAQRGELRLLHVCGTTVWLQNSATALVTSGRLAVQTPSIFGARRRGTIPDVFG